MMPKPAVPLGPVTVKSIAVDASVWFVVMQRFVICELVMFPSISMLIVVPLSVVAGTVVSGVGFGVGLVVGGGFGVGVVVGNGGRV